MKYFHVDAFASRPFTGNQAGVCILEENIPDDVILQKMANEHNLAETAYIYPKTSDGHYPLLWFTPMAEVDFCGHATLASGHVILSELKLEDRSVSFETRSGILTVTQIKNGYQMDFPQVMGDSCELPESLIGTLSEQTIECFWGEKLMVVLKDEAFLRSFQPDYPQIASIDAQGLLITSEGSNYDFVSRFFAPRVGIPEDPVTGSAHCMAAPYWAKKLGKSQLRAYQASPRGGEVWCRVTNDRVILEGQAITYFKAELPTVH